MLPSPAEAATNHRAVRQEKEIKASNQKGRNKILYIYVKFQRFPPQAVKPNKQIQKSFRKQNHFYPITINSLPPKGVGREKAQLESHNRIKNNKIFINKFYQENERS